jgi:hypothetical protein
MFETAADNSSILSIDLGLLIGLLVLKRLLDLCVPKFISEFIKQQNRLGWRDDRADLLRSCRADLVIQVEDPA